MSSQFTKMSISSILIAPCHSPKKDEPSRPWWTKPFEDMGTYLWTNSKSKDFQIVIDGRVINVHKCVLAARSPVFASMLTSEEAQSSGQLKIQDFDFDTVHMAIRFFYSQRFDIETNFWTLSLLTFGHKYEIQHLIRACLHRMKMTRNNCGNSQRKFLIKSAVNLGSEQILDTILNIFGATKGGERVPEKCHYPVVGDELLFQDDLFKDLKIICDDGEEFSVHKSILVLRSPVFAQIFDKMAEKGDTSGQIIIDRIKPIVFENAVEFFYTGYITQDHKSFDQNPQLFLGLLEFSDRFKVEELASLCLKKIHQSVKKQLGLGQEMVSICVKTAANFESKKIFHFILGIFGTHGFDTLDFDIEIEKTSTESYWN